MNSIQSDPKSWIYSFIIGGITFYVVKFYYKVKQYPSGPFPLPFIGNLFCKFYYNKYLYNYYHFFKAMMRWKKNIFDEFLNLAKIHGPICTFWFGHKPSIIITDLEIAKEAFLEKKN